MNSKKIVIEITKTLFLMAIVFLMVACENDFGTMHLNRSMNMDHLNWVPILISLVIGFVLGMLFSKRRRW
jgi:uncharacterized membrane protein affecting hemolysin expression